MEKSEMKEYLQFLETKRKEAINAGSKTVEEGNASGIMASVIFLF